MCSHPTCGSQRSTANLIMKRPFYFLYIRALSHSQDLRVFFTRRLPIYSSKVHSLIDFNFHSIFPSSLLSSFPLEQNFWERRRKLSSHRNGTKVSKKRAKQQLRFEVCPLLTKGQNNKCRPNWGALPRQKRQNVTFWQRQTPHSVINSLKKAEPKREQRGAAL